MNKIKTTLLILFAIIIVILIFFLVKNIKNDNSNGDKKKIISEIKYMDTKLSSLLNSINNITLENYKISVTKTSSNSSNNSSSSSASNSSSDSSSDSQQEDTSKTSTNSTTEQYELKQEGILTGNSEIDWNTLKNEIELLYSMIPTLTLDLYSINLNQEEILGFNKELDELTMAVKEENKEKTLIKLADLYRYLPVYASNASKDSKYLNLIDTKSNIIKAYVYTNLDNWDEVKNHTKKAIESYSAIINNIDDTNNNYDTNKIYVILNEIDNSANMRDKDLFFIKYKMFLEETEKLLT